MNHLKYLQFSIQNVVNKFDILCVNKLVTCMRSKHNRIQSKLALNIGALRGMARKLVEQILGIF